MPHPALPHDGEALHQFVIWRPESKELFSVTRASLVVSTADDVVVAARIA